MAAPEIPHALRRAAPVWLLVVGLVAAALTAVAMVWADAPIARAIAPWQPWAGWEKGVDALEWVLGLPVWRFATNAVVVGGMLVAIAVRRRAAPAWMFVAATHLVTRLLMGHLKDWTGRLRPTEWLAHHQPANSFGWAIGASFPSGHVVLFASLVLPIVALSPRWWPLLVPVGFVMAARMAVGAHFLSDVLGAIALVALGAWLVSLAIRPRPPAPAVH